MTHVISNSIDGLENLKTSNQYLKKIVITKSGTKLGRVTDIILIKDTVQGILVSDIFIDKEFIRSNKERIMLDMDPITRVIGFQVFDSEGKQLGKVKEIKMKGNILRSIMVKHGMFSKEIEIDAKKIATDKKNIILKGTL